MRKIAFALLSLAIGAFAAFAFVEIGMRILGIAYPLFVVPDSVAGVRMWPNLKAWYTLEGRAFVEVNSIGFRDVEHEREKPENEFRFALLGDSFTAGMEVPFDDLYFNVAKRALAQCPGLSGRRPVPIAFGISGIGTAQELEILRNTAWDYDPDLIILAFVSNDFTDNHPAFGGGAAKPFYLFDDSGQLVLDDSFKTSPGHALRTSPIRNLRRQAIQSSRMLQLMLELYNAMARRSALSEMAERAGSFNRLPETRPVAEAWSITEAAIGLMAKEVEAREKDFLFFSVSTGHQVHPDREQRIARLADTHGGSLFYWNERLERFAAQNGIEYLDIIEPLLSHAEASQRCVHGFENAIPC